MLEIPRARKTSNLSIGPMSLFLSPMKTISSTTLRRKSDSRLERRLQFDLTDVDPRTIHLFQHLPEAPKVEVPEIGGPRKDREYTLVLDIDETLVHCSSDPSLPYVFEIEVAPENNSNAPAKKYYVRKRPNTDYFLQEVSQHFEVIAFTAGYKRYANRILDYLDPEGTIFSHRLYRDSCYIKDRKYIKNLNALGRDLNKTILVDNSIEALGFQLDNGVLIKSWTSDPYDDQLLLVLDVLSNLLVVQANVPRYLRNQFGLSRFIEHQIDLMHQHH